MPKGICSRRPCTSRSGRGLGLERVAANSHEPRGDLLATDRSGNRNGQDCRPGENGMRNTWIIFQKELRSYFVSPIAWLLLTMFAVIFGFFFWNGLAYFDFVGMQQQMRGETFPMNINEQIIRPLLNNASVIGLF